MEGPPRSSQCKRDGRCGSRGERRGSGRRRARSRRDRRACSRRGRRSSSRCIVVAAVAAVVSDAAVASVACPRNIRRGRRDRRDASRLAVVGPRPGAFSRLASAACSGIPAVNAQSGAVAHQRWLGVPGMAVIGRHWRPRIFVGSRTHRVVAQGAIVSKLETCEKGGKTREAKTGKTCGQISQICSQVLRTAVCPSLSSKTRGQNLQTCREIDETQKCPLAPAYAFSPPCRKRQARPRRIAEAGGGPAGNTRG